MQEPVRQKLPRTRTAKTFSFRVADCHGYATVGEYEDGRPGELFLQVAKGGSTLAGIMDAFAISVSHGLQYGVPLEAFVEMFTNMRFEPAGMTDDPEHPVRDEPRRLHLPPDGGRVPRAGEAGGARDPHGGGAPAADAARRRGVDHADGAVARPAARGSCAVGRARARPKRRQQPNAAGRRRATREVVLCHVCGDMMQRAGSCYACPSCGSTSGCS